MTADRNPLPLYPSSIATPPGRFSPYPAPYNETPGDVSWTQLGGALGLRNFGVNIVTLFPGAISAQRHWHKA